MSAKTSVVADMEGATLVKWRRDIAGVLGGTSAVQGTAENVRGQKTYSSETTCAPPTEVAGVPVPEPDGAAAAAGRRCFGSALFALPPAGLAFGPPLALALPPVHAHSVRNSKKARSSEEPLLKSHSTEIASPLMCWV